MRAEVINKRGRCQGRASNRGGHFKSQLVRMGGRRGLFCLFRSFALAWAAENHKGSLQFQTTLCSQSREALVPLFHKCTRQALAPKYLGLGKARQSPWPGLTYRQAIFAAGPQIAYVQSYIEHGRQNDRHRINHSLQRDILCTVYLTVVREREYVLR